jgi:hypothetical protein
LAEEDGLLADDENDGVHMNTKASIVRVVFLSALVGTQACVRIGRAGTAKPLPEPGVNKGSPSAGRNARSPEAYGLEPVHGKEDPATLIARDGTTCTVGKKKYESTQIGKSACCTWIERRR